jgi:hypothetical protein
MANVFPSALRKPESTSLETIHTHSRAYPKYLHKRGGQFYFRRKIPSDVAYAFTQVRDQVWTALGTGLLEKARVLLAVEVTEFELKVAKLRKQNAHDKVCELGLFSPAGNGVSKLLPILLPRMHQVQAKNPLLNCQRPTMEIYPFS